MRATKQEIFKHVQSPTPAAMSLEIEYASRGWQIPKLDYAFHSGREQIIGLAWVWFITTKGQCLNRFLVAIQNRDVRPIVDVEQANRFVPFFFKKGCKNLTFFFFLCTHFEPEHNKFEEQMTTLTSSRCSLNFFTAWANSPSFALICHAWMLLSELALKSKLASSE